MYTIREVSAGGIPVLGTYKLRLDKYPLVVIRGNNLDKKNQKSSSNGSGKTMSVSPIPTLIYETTPNSLKKKASKDLLKSKNSFIEMKFYDGKERIVKKELTSSVKHFITTNGVVSSYRKPDEARSAIQKLFPLSEEAFYSQLFINGRQKSILQSGTPAQRFAYLETIFQLNEYDKLNTLVNKDYTHAKRLIQELGVLISEKKERKSSLPAIDNIVLAKKQKQIESDIDKFGARVEKYIELHNNTKTYLSLVDGLDTSKSLDALNVELDEANKELVDMNKLYKKSIRHYEALEQNEGLRRRRQRLKEDIKAIHGDSNLLSEIDDKVERLDKKLKEVSKSLEDAEDNNRIYNTAKARLKLMDVKVIPETYADKSIKLLEKLKIKNDIVQKEKVASKKNLKDFIEHSHEGQNCPVCQRGLSKKAAQQLVSLLDKQINSCMRRGDALDRYTKVKRYTQEMEDNPYVDVEELEVKVQKYNGLMETYTEQSKAINRKLQLKARLADLPKAEAIEDTTVPKPFVYEDTIKDLNTRIGTLESSISTHKRIERLGFAFEKLEVVTEQHNTYKDKLSKYRPILQDLQIELSKLIAKSSVYDSILSDINRLIEKINDLKLETKDFKVLEALKKAFGNKGLKKIKTKYYIDQLQNAFNKYSHYIFAEPVKFLFQATDTQFDILCEINGNITDARKLSGAESSCFTLLLILCVLPFIPSNLRTNLLILDEIESGFDSGTQNKFVEDFLPILQKIVKNVVIITPKSEAEFYIPNARTVLVTKKNGKSSIKML